MDKSTFKWKENIEHIVNSAKNKIVTLNIEKATVNYTDKITKYEDPKVITGDEEISRAFLVNRLINDLDYKPGFIEIEKRYEISLGRSTKKLKGENDLILRDNKGDVFYLIETKSPKEFESGKKTIIGQLFGIAREEARKNKVYYLCYYTTDFSDGNTRDKAILIDFEKFQEYDDWLKSGEPSVGNILSPGYDKPKKQPKIKGDVKYDLQKSISREELSGLANDIHDVLWGGGGTNDSDIFYSLVNLILAKIQDESEREDGEEYYFQVHAYGDNIELPEKIYDRVSDLYRRALEKKLNITDKNKLDDARVIDRNKLSLNKLVYTVQALERYSFIEGRNSYDNKDILGDFFEQITREGFKQTKGQFFTPTTIVKFICYALKIDELAISKINESGSLPYIIDPAVGSGSFLIEAMKIITKECKYKQRDKIKSSYEVKGWFESLFSPDHKENQWARLYLYGAENNHDLGTAAKVNMILHGDGASNIFIQDGLKPFNEFKKSDLEANALEINDGDKYYGNRDVNRKFDVVISNPPFSVTLEAETKKTLERSFLFGNKKNSENLFIERWYQLLKDGGRLGVVLPESVFDTTENKYIRIFIYKYFEIKAVVSLPQLTFEPYTSTKTSLLFAQKKGQKELEEWNRIWNKHSKEWTSLKTKVENYLKVYIEGKDINKFPSIREHTQSVIRENVEKYLSSFLLNSDKDLGIKDLCIKYQLTINEIGEFDKDLIEQFGYVNIWWVFKKVSYELNYDIFMAEVENVGYKRTKRGEKQMQNDLYDEEIAPEFIPYEDIMRSIDNKLQIHLTAKKELETSATRMSIKNTAISDKKSLKNKNEIDWHSVEINRIEEQKKEIDNIIDHYYEKGNGGKLRLKDKFKDRFDNMLTDYFKNGILSEYSSSDVLLRLQNPIKILDKIRKEVVW